MNRVRTAHLWTPPAFRMPSSVLLLPQVELCGAVGPLMRRAAMREFNSVSAAAVNA